MDLKFIKFEKQESMADAIVLNFYFEKLEEDECYKISVQTKLGAEISWQLVDKIKLEDYSKKVFFYLVEFILDKWNNSKELPNNNTVLHESYELPIFRDKSLNHKDYVIILK